MIGMVQFVTHRGESAEAILDEAGRWHCPQMPVLVRVLDALYEPRPEVTDEGPRGHEQLRAAATWLKGTVRLEPPAPYPSGADAFHLVPAHAGRD